MSSRVIASLCAALSLVAAPVAVQASPANRTSAPAVEENELGGNILWILLAIAAVVAAVLILDDNDDPASP